MPDSMSITMKVLSHQVVCQDACHSGDRTKQRSQMVASRPNRPGPHQTEPRWTPAPDNGIDSGLKLGSPSTPWTLIHSHAHTISMSIPHDLLPYSLDSNEK